MTGWARFGPRALSLTHWTVKAISFFLRPELRPTCREFKDKKMWVQIGSSDPFPVGLRVWFLAFCRPLLLVNDGRHWCFLWINYLHLHQWQRTARRGRPGLEPGHTPENYCWENTHTHTRTCVYTTQTYRIEPSFIRSAKLHRRLTIRADQRRLVWLLSGTVSITMTHTQKTTSLYLRQSDASHI